MWIRVETNSIEVFLENERWEREREREPIVIFTLPLSWIYRSYLVRHTVNWWAILLRYMMNQNTSRLRVFCFSCQSKCRTWKILILFESCCLRIVLLWMLSSIFEWLEVIRSFFWGSMHCWNKWPKWPLLGLKGGKINSGAIFLLHQSKYKGDEKIT